MLIKFKKLSKTARTPEKNHETDAGIDFFADKDIDIGIGETKAVSTGIAWEPTFGTGMTEQNFSNFFYIYMKIQGRSGLALKKAIEVFGGTIDVDYRGEIKIILHNAGKETFSVVKGDKIAQGIVYIIPKYKVETIEMTEEEEAEAEKEAKKLSETERGEDGFGSSDEPKKVFYA